MKLASAHRFLRTLQFLPILDHSQLRRWQVASDVGVGTRWARRGGAGASLAANALLLALGMGIVTTPPQRGVEQAQEEHDKAGGESGDPPTA